MELLVTKLQHSLICHAACVLQRHTKLKHISQSSRRPARDACLQKLVASYNKLFPAFSGLSNIVKSDLRKFYFLGVMAGCGHLILCSCRVCSLVAQRNGHLGHLDFWMERQQELLSTGVRIGEDQIQLVPHRAPFPALVHSSRARSGPPWGSFCFIDFRQFFRTLPQPCKPPQLSNQTFKVHRL